ncbi:Protein DETOXIFICATION 41 [Asimina triloba]
MRKVSPADPSAIHDMGDSTSEPLITSRTIIHASSEEMEEILSQEKVPARVMISAALWESKVLWSLSGASIIVSIFNFMLSLTTQMFSGHLGALELAGASIANVGIQGLAYGLMLIDRAVDRLY